MSDEIKTVLKKRRGPGKIEYNVEPVLFGVKQVHQYFGGGIGLNSIRTWIKNYNTRHGVVRGSTRILIPRAECEKLADLIGRELVVIGDCIIDPPVCNKYNKEYIRAGVRHHKNKGV